MARMFIVIKDSRNYCEPLDRRATIYVEQLGSQIISATTDLETVNKK